MKFERVKALSGAFPVGLLCETFKLRPNSYYVWLRREPSAHEQDNQALQDKIRSVWSDLCCAAYLGGMRAR